MLYDAEYRKPLRLAAAIGLGVWILVQVVSYLILKEKIYLWHVGIMVLEALTALVILRGERAFLTAVPVMVLAIWEAVLFFVSDPAALRFSTPHFLSLIVMAILFVMSMVGEVPEMQKRIVVFFFVLLACWGYDIALAISGALGEMSVTKILDLIMVPLTYGLCSAWAAFPRIYHTLSEEEIEKKIEQYQKLLSTGMLSPKEYKASVRRLLKKRK